MLRTLYRTFLQNRKLLQEPWEGVPEALRNLSAPPFDLPADRDGWILKRPGILAKIRDCLGQLPPRPKPLAVRTSTVEDAEEYRLERFVFDNGVDSMVPGYVALPLNVTAPVPALLVAHGHGGSKEQIFGRTRSQQNVAARLVRRGFAVASIDSYFSGERKGTGPNGIRRFRTRLARSDEDSWFKLHLWFGRTLWGMMLRDQQIALDYLQSRPEIDSNRIGAQGMSMGSTCSWWLAALDERIRAVAAVACFTRYEDLIATRGLGEHAIYYFVPGILRYFDTEAIISLIAPRPLLTLTGDRDPGSPPTGIRKLGEIASHIYGLYGSQACFQNVVYQATGHVYTEKMKQRMESWFVKYLNAP